MSNIQQLPPRARAMYHQVYDRDMGNKRSKGGLILKTLRRCQSLGSLHRRAAQEKQQQVLPPEGCFSVCVGPARQRFTVRTDCLNHPLFHKLLDEAEMELGFSANGPLELPCGVELFRKVLLQVEHDKAELRSPTTCNFRKGYYYTRTLSLD